MNIFIGAMHQSVPFNDSETPQEQTLYPLFLLFINQIGILIPRIRALSHFAASEIEICAIWMLLGERPGVIHKHKFSLKF